jgi:UBX domain
LQRLALMEEVRLPSLCNVPTDNSRSLEHVCVSLSFSLPCALIHVMYAQVSEANESNAGVPADSSSNLRSRNSGGTNGPLSAPRQPSGALHNHNNPHATPNLLEQWIIVLTSIVKVLLWPLRQVTAILFPTHELDGLAPAVTAKAAAQGVAYLQSVAQQSSLTPTIAVAWAADRGFAALQQHAVATKSLLVVHLHAPLHSQAQRFCSETLNHAVMLAFLQQDLILATTYSIHTAQGAQLQSMLQITSFPAIAVLQPNPSSLSTGPAVNGRNVSTVLHLVLLVQGTVNCRLDTLLPLLQGTHQRHLTVLAEFEVRRLQRLQETELRRQQDEEYQATLAADQQRARAVAQERDAERAQQAALDREREAATRALQVARDLVEPEPPSGGTMIRLVLPSGAKINRRFAAHATMATVKAFLKVHFTESNSTIVNVGLSTSFPRKTFDEADDALTLEEAGLVPQAVLMVQDLDA